MDGHEQPALSDEILDREIAAALDVQPSPEFVARVRARVAAEPAGGGWGARLLFTSGRPRRLGGTEVMWSSAAAAVVVAVVAVWMTRHVPETPASQVAEAPSVERPAAVRGPVESAAVGHDLDEAKPPDRGVVRNTSTRKSRALPLPALGKARSEPEVLISQEEAAALRRLFAASQRGRVDPAVFLQLDEMAEAIAPIEELVLEPISTRPLVELDSE